MAGTCYPWLAAIIYYLTIEWLGMLISSALLLGFLMLLGDERRYWLIATISVLLPTLLYLFFTYIGNVVLPPGIFFR